MEGIESRGCGLKAVIETANDTAASTMARRPKLLASRKTGIAGLYSSTISKKAAVQRCLAALKA
jgi:hypothetical protein